MYNIYSCVLYTYIYILCTADHIRTVIIKFLVTRSAAWFFEFHEQPRRQQAHTHPHIIKNFEHLGECVWCGSAAAPACERCNFVLSHHHHICTTSCTPTPSPKRHTLKTFNNFPTNKTIFAHTHKIKTPLHILCARRSHNCGLNKLYKYHHHTPSSSSSSSRTVITSSSLTKGISCARIASIRRGPFSQCLHIFCWPKHKNITFQYNMNAHSVRFHINILPKTKYLNWFYYIVVSFYYTKKVLNLNNQNIYSFFLN